jgi:hypothetical protein
MVGWRLIIVFVVDTSKPNCGCTDPIIKVVIECFRPDFSMTHPNNCILV